MALAAVADIVNGKEMFHEIDVLRDLSGAWLQIFGANARAQECEGHQRQEGSRKTLIASFYVIPAE